MMQQPNKQDNIAEYLIYMWQIEDILRVYQLDIDKVQQFVINSTYTSENERNEAREWFEGLIMMMKSEGVQQKGHLQINKNIIIELTDLHLQLLNNPAESAYIAIYYKTLPYIVELRAKSDNNEMPEIETCFIALYGYLLLKLQKREISNETEVAIRQIKTMMSLLAEKYKTKDKEEQ